MGDNLISGTVVVGYVLSFPFPCLQRPSGDESRDPEDGGFYRGVGASESASLLRGANGGYALHPTQHNAYTESRTSLHEEVSAQNT